MQMIKKLDYIIQIDDKEFYKFFNDYLKLVLVVSMVWEDQDII